MPPKNKKTTERLGGDGIAFLRLAMFASAFSTDAKIAF
jgi:hypothetical protein